MKYRLPKADIGASEAASVKGDTVTNDIIIEFKQDGADLVDDIDRDRKKYADLDLLVCWDLDDARLAKENIHVEPVTANNVYFFGTTHRILFPPYFALGHGNALPVVVLKDIARPRQVARRPTLKRKRL